jgi:ATP-dependent RNA helicase DDX49/DBP8
VIACAKTGSGKTAAFALPILEELGKDPYGIFGLVLTPTRELAFQIAEQFRALAMSTSLRTCIVIGGLDMLTQSLELQKHPHIVIATPGRLADHLSSGLQANWKHLAFVVFDEADRLFDDCFDDDLDMIMSSLPEPERRQTLFFSATMQMSNPKITRYGM